MRLCIVTPSVIKGDGQGRANYEIVWEAIRRGHHVTLLTRKVAPELQNHPQVTWVSFAVEGWPTALLQEISFAWQSQAWLQQHRSEFDLLQTYGAVTPVAANINTSQFVHSAWLRSPAHISRLRRDAYGAYQWLYTALNARWERQAFAQAKQVIAVSQRVKKELMELGITEERIQVIYNGVDVEEFSPSVGDRQALNLPTQVPLALFAGDIRTNRKNLDTVLQALVQVPDLHLAVVGATDGSPYPDLAGELGIRDRVHFMGFRRDLPEIMRSVDLFVFPSRYEPFGMVVSEAMASGLPVVTAITTGAAEIVTPDCGVVLWNSEDAVALAEALRRLAADPELRSRMGEMGRAIAEQHSWRSKARSYIDLFEQVGQL